MKYPRLSRSSQFAFPVAKSADAAWNVDADGIDGTNSLLVVGEAITAVRPSGFFNGTPPFRVSGIVVPTQSHLVHFPKSPSTASHSL